jgi:hypothetical protein
MHDNEAWRKPSPTTRRVFRGRGVHVEALVPRLRRMPAGRRLRAVGSVPIIKLLAW